MKKIILLIATMVLSINLADAQNVIKNERNEHGVRIIDADMGMAYEDGKAYGVTLSYHEINGVENYYMMLAIPEVSPSFSILKDQQILFKISDEEKCLGLAVTNSSMSAGAAAGRIIRSVIVMYVIAPDSIQKMAENGVSKIRVNYNTNGKDTFFDIETSEGNFSKYLKRAYKNITKTIPLPVDKDRSEF